MLTNKSISLLVSGSIAAYKSAELVRELKKNGAEVRVVMSHAAQQFITPLTMQTLSGSQVYTNLFDLESEREIGHISLADKADVVLCAPASADLLAKAAHGIADDLLTTVILATKSPIIFVPAMNVNMWEAKVTQSNVNKLKDLGHYVLEPDDGSLACGWVGKGRMPELNKILDLVQDVLTPKILLGTRVLVTAGPTIESVDPVRFLSNRASGKMGYAIARMASMMGAEVTLISGPTNLNPPSNLKFIQVETAQEMRNAVIKDLKKEEQGINKLQVVYMAAAVSDHRPSEISSSKLKMDKSKGYNLSFLPSEDILAEIGASRNEIEQNSKLRLLIVGFAAETGNQEEMIESARGKLERKNADLVVANFALENFGADSARVWFVAKNGEQREVGPLDKNMIAEKIIKFSLKV